MVRKQCAAIGRFFALSLVVGLTAIASSDGSNAEDTLRVLTAESTTVPPAEQLQAYLKQQAFRQLDERLAAFADLQSLADHKRWQSERRQFFIDQIGGFPERTPLNAKIVGQLRGQGYRVEKILFESRPGHPLRHPANLEMGFLYNHPNGCGMLRVPPLPLAKQP